MDRVEYHTIALYVTADLKPPVIGEVHKNFMLLLVRESSMLYVVNKSAIKTRDDKSAAIPQRNLEPKNVTINRWREKYLVRRGFESGASRAIYSAIRFE